MTRSTWSAMTRRVLILALTTLVARRAVGQEPSGARAGQQAGPAGTRRAVIVGVSKYPYFPRESQLSDAVADAEMLYDLLTSKAGGAVPAKNIRKLLDQGARGHEIREALAWLTSESKEGDDAIIYFAGHEDADTSGGEESSYLLATDALPWDYESGGGIAVDHVANVGRAIASKRATVLVIIDGWCDRSVSGGRATGATTTPLEESPGVATLISSSAGQCSYEGAQWGGGHGVFTYFLVAGLEGVADLNGDGVVTFGELGRYVTERVAAETHRRQTPRYGGDVNRVLARVDTAVVRAARARLRVRPDSATAR